MPRGVSLPGVGTSVTRVLGDARSRAVLMHLARARRPVRLDELLPVAGGVSPRVLRDHLRPLERARIVLATPWRSGDALAREAPAWRLAPPGVELHRISTLMTRIVATTLDLPSRLPPETRDEITRQVVESLGNPVVLATVRTLAARPHFAGELEAAVASSAPRRTLYRRLTQLVSADVIARTTTHEVPRRTRYELLPRWRPLVLIPVLAAWWEWRNGAAEVAPASSDLEGLAHALAPLVTPPPTVDGARVRWTVQSGEGSAAVDLVCEGYTLRTEEPTGVAFDAEVRATPDAWCGALVTRDTRSLQVRGDAVVAAAVGRAARSALLAPLRNGPLGP